MAFLPRHGRGHRFSPSDINYRANIDAMKRLGVTDLVSVSAVGSLREDLPPGDVRPRRPVHRPHGRAAAELLRDRLRRARLDGAAGEPPGLGDRIAAAGRAEAIACRRGGTLVVIEGPAFSSEAKSRLYRGWGADLVGMTAMPEAKLAREAEIAYATLAMVTDYDAWHPGHEAVDVAAVVRVLGENRDRVRRLLARLARDFPGRARALPLCRPRPRRRGDDGARGPGSGRDREARCGGAKDSAPAA